MPDNPFAHIPDVDFVPMTVDELLEEMIADYEQEYYRQTGVRKSVVPSSEARIQLYTEAARFHTAYRLIDRGCKMNLLKYSEEDYLENLAALFGLERLPAQPSVSRVEFTLSAPQEKAVYIPMGTRVSTPDKIYFETMETLAIPAGETKGEVNIRSQDTGARTAGILPGQICILVDPIAYVSKAVNTHSTQGGVDIEDDESLRIKIYYYRNSNSLHPLVCGKSLTWHSLYIATACPGPYLRERMQYICDEANRMNAGGEETQKTVYAVMKQVIALRDEAAAKKCAAEMQKQEPGAYWFVREKMV